MKPLNSRQSLLANISISVLTVVLCLGGLEFVAYLWERNLANSPLGWELVGSRRIQVNPSGNPRINAVLRPNVDYVWEGISVHINAQGLRGVEHAFAKNDGVYRVLSLGDSVAFGWEVREEETYAKVLEAHLHVNGLPTAEVVNAGVPGWDLPIELAYLEETGLRYDPNVIVVELTVENDLYHTTYQIPPPSLIEWLRGHTYSWGFLSFTFRQARENLRNLNQGQKAESSTEPSYPFPLDQDDPLWDEYVRTPLVQMAHVAEQSGAKLVVLVVPTDAQVRWAATGYPTTPQEVVAQLAAERGIVVIDLLPVFQAAYAESGAAPEAPNPLFADRSSHPSVQGHQLIANTLYKTLEAEGLLAAP